MTDRLTDRSGGCTGASAMSAFPGCLITRLSTRDHPKVDLLVAIVFVLVQPTMVEDGTSCRAAIVMQRDIHDA